MLNVALVVVVLLQIGQYGPWPFPLIPHGACALATLGIAGLLLERRTPFYFRGNALSFGILAAVAAFLALVNSSPRDCDWSTTRPMFGYPWPSLAGPATSGNVFFWAILLISCGFALERQLCRLRAPHRAPVPGTLIGISLVCFSFSPRLGPYPRDLWGLVAPKAFPLDHWDPELFLLMSCFVIGAVSLVRIALDLIRAERHPAGASP